MLVFFATQMQAVEQLQFLTIFKPDHAKENTDQGTLQCFIVILSAFMCYACRKFVLSFYPLMYGIYVVMNC